MDVAVRTARRKDIPALCGIWRACFPDTEDYIRYFYRENFERIAVWVRTVDDAPVSMLHLFDAAFADGGYSRPAKLIYAVGTHPSYRRQGHMGRLLEAVKGRAREEGHVLFLKPATAELTEYYRSFGFEPDARFRVVTIRPGERVPLQTDMLSAQEYNRLRDIAFSGYPYAKWPDRHVQWCVDENEYCGGRTLSVMLDGETHFVMGAPQGDTLLITETDMGPSQLERAGGALCALFGAASLKAYLPDHVCGKGEEIVSSAVYNAPLRDTYVNLIMI
ncbi:MAG: GNAT family N-acetyltransferase [Clostridiales bacterium]|nr:GNAT family N-acetyltransferase [Clostridiales bacterium]